ncbi:MAG TPA: YqgE/AlgH family protein [Cellvibrio sp.]|nr:YqgE/AlgH family protein [Cellvibrio sp.]
MTEKLTYDIDTTDLATGNLSDHFLIAMPSMQDTSFAQSVTYICEHNENGAMGIVINNPLPMTLAEIFAQMNLEDTAHQGSAPIVAGGPVQIERGFVLHPSDSQWNSTIKVSEDISVTASRDIIDALAAGHGPKPCLLALGYAGWDKGQLEAEIAANSWLTVPADKNIIFNTPFEQRWTLAALALGINVSLIANTAGHA